MEQIISFYNIAPFKSKRLPNSFNTWIAFSNFYSIILPESILHSYNRLPSYLSALCCFSFNILLRLFVFLLVMEYPNQTTHRKATLFSKSHHSHNTPSFTIETKAVSKSFVPATLFNSSAVPTARSRPSFIIPILSDRVSASSM